MISLTFWPISVTRAIEHGQADVGGAGGGHDSAGPVAIVEAVVQPAARSARSARPTWANNTVPMNSATSIEFYTFKANHDRNCRIFTIKWACDDELWPSGTGLRTGRAARVSTGAGQDRGQPAGFNPANKLKQI